MTDFIEQDALNSTPDVPHETHEHTHEEVKTLIAMPRGLDEGLVEKVVAWFKGDHPNAPLVYKTTSGLRRMILFTSNSYIDREGETITSKALEDYEASCYPGEDLYHNENPMLWWHDDDVPMGTIESVEYITPFLIEVGQELPNDPISKALWDYAEQNGDAAGVSHRFGYMEKDRDPDGTFHRIFKQETSYLPERSLAANDKTYAGVLTPMSIPESRKRMGKILADMTGDKEIEDILHTDGVPAVRKRLAAQGLQHKAAKPPFPPKADDATKPVMEGEIASDEAVIEEDAEAIDEKEEMAPPADSTADMARMLVVMDGFYNMLQTMIETQADSELDRIGMMKAFDELKEGQVSEKAADKVTIGSLEAKVKALEEKQASIEKRLNQAPRSASQTQASSDPEIAKRIVSEAIDGAEKAKKEGDLIESSMFGKVLPPIKYD